MRKKVENAPALAPSLGTLVPAHAPAPAPILPLQAMHSTLPRTPAAAPTALPPDSKRDSDNSLAAAAWSFPSEEAVHS